MDFQDEKVKETIAKLSLETGMSLEEIIEQYKYYSDNREYVRFVSGPYKGKVGYVFPNPEIFPYAKEVYTNDSMIWCPLWQAKLVIISKEEYEKALEEANID